MRYYELTYKTTELTAIGYRSVYENKVTLPAINGKEAKEQALKYLEDHHILNNSLYAKIRLYRKSMDGYITYTWFYDREKGGWRA